MRTYLDRLLVEGERVVRRSRRHLLPVLLRPVLLHLGLLGMAAAVTWAAGTRPELLPFSVPGPLVALLPCLPLPYTLYAYLAWRTREFAVTDLRVMKVEGILSKRHHDASLDKINDLGLRQSLLGRLLGWGDLTVFTGNDAHGIAYRGVRNPVEFKRSVTMSKQSGAGPDLLDRLERLGRLREQGVLTQEELEIQKREILDER